MDAQIPTTWPAMIAFFVTTGLFSLIWTAAIEAWKANRVTSREAKYLAARTAVALEAHAIECWNALQMEDADYRETGRPSLSSLPAPPRFPEDVNWQSIAPELAVKIFSFVNEGAIEEHAARFARIYEGNPFDYASATQKQGKAAWALARELRRHHGLPHLDDQRARLTDLDR